MLFDEHPPTGELGQTYMADLYGFSLHAAVRCGAKDRQALEYLCRYITRPALANERVQTNAAGQVVVKLKIAWRDGTTLLEMSPLEFTHQPLASCSFPASLLTVPARDRPLRFSGLASSGRRWPPDLNPLRTAAALGAHR